MKRLCKKSPVKFSLLTPLTLLAKFLTHEEELFAGMSEHKCISGPKVSKLICLIARHLLKHRTLKMYYFVMGQRKDIVLSFVIAHSKGHHVMSTLTEIWIKLHIFAEVVHPAHVPLK